MVALLLAISNTVCTMVRDRTARTASRICGAVVLSVVPPVLRDGRCIGLGTHADLISTCPLYAEMWRAQQTFTARLAEAG
jgi:ABC-type transport system involved in Fe-S cluster assembly fused permease/ATPase subunit